MSWKRISSSRVVLTRSVWFYHSIHYFTYLLQLTMSFRRRLVGISFFVYYNCMLKISNRIITPRSISNINVWPPWYWPPPSNAKYLIHMLVEVQVLIVFDVIVLDCHRYFLMFANFLLIFIRWKLETKNVTSWMDSDYTSPPNWEIQPILLRFVEITFTICFYLIDLGLELAI